MLSIDRHPKAPHAAVPSEAVPLPTGVDHTMIDMISTIDVRKMTSRRLIVNLIFQPNSNVGTIGLAWTSQ